MSTENTNSKYEAYYEMRRRCNDKESATYPVELLIKWDEVRLKLNPEAKLSYAQELLQQRREQSEGICN